MAVLLIDEKVSRGISSHAESGYPEEICGFVYGKETGEERTITHYLPVENAKEENRAKRFEVTPQDYMKAERKADELGVELLGIYHSHPDHPAVPSKHDHAVASPFFSYLIASVREGKFARLTSWQLDENRQFEREIIETENKELVN